MVPDAHAIPTWNKPCWKAYYTWQKKPGHKAFAISSSSSMVSQHCAAVWGASSKAVAEKEAMKQCRSRWSDAATCRITESE
jgi:hypothetical protein